MENKLTFEVIAEAMRRVAARGEEEVRKAIENGEYIPPPHYEPLSKDISIEALQKIRDDYPKECYQCNGPLNGPGTDEELIEQIEEHDGLFSGASLATAEIICDTCFHQICPGGKLLSEN